MTTLLRVEMILVAFTFVVVVFWAVNKKKLLLKYSLIWLVISFSIVIIALFPQIAYLITDLVGIETVSNLIYLLGITSLLIITFSLSVIVSHQSNRIKNLVQMVSIKQYSEKLDCLEKETQDSEISCKS